MSSDALDAALLTEALQASAYAGMAMGVFVGFWVHACLEWVTERIASRVAAEREAEGT